MRLRVPASEQPPDGQGREFRAFIVSLVIAGLVVGVAAVTIAFDGAGDVFPNYGSIGHYDWFGRVAEGGAARPEDLAGFAGDVEVDGAHVIVRVNGRMMEEIHATQARDGTWRPGMVKTCVSYRSS